MPTYRDADMLTQRDAEQAAARAVGHSSLTDPAGKPPFPHLVNLIADAQEREPLNLPYLHSWTAAHLNRLLADYQASVKRETPTPAGALGCPAQPPD